MTKQETHAQAHERAGQALAWLLCAVGVLTAVSVLVYRFEGAGRDATTPFTAAHHESFPALTTDGAGTTWLATLARPVPGRHVQVDRVTAGRRAALTTLAPDGLTGIGPPAVAPLASGCVVAFSVEQRDQWRIAVAFVDSEGPALRVLDLGGARVARAPDVAVVGERAWLVWESDADGPRGIYVTWATREAVGVPRRLSSPAHASRNPAVVRFGDPERLFVAWDSFRDGSVDLYAAEGIGEQWTSEARLTSDPRIERHVSLAALGDEVWLAWDAKAFWEHRVNAGFERRVFVARTRGVAAGGGLRDAAPAGVRVADGDLRPLQPWIGVDPAGGVWLTARAAELLTKRGFHTLVWNTTADGWSEARELSGETGRASPVPIAWDAARGFGAVQRDDLPTGWGEGGIRPDWRSQVDLVAVERPADAGPAAGGGAPVPFRSPPSSFRIADHLHEMSAGLPRQRANHAGRALTLYWGDLHEHSDVSVCQRSRNPALPDLWANQRDIEALDFTAVTDHGYDLDWPQWQYSGEIVRAFHEPGRFVTFLGEEWTSDRKPDGRLTGPGRYGHRNLIFRDPHHPRFYDAHDGDITPARLWDEFGAADVLTIPHQLADTGNVPTDWRFHDDARQPVAEIFQARGSYEALGAPQQADRSQDVAGNFLQDAWARGITIGVIASSDHGGGRGKAGVWARELSRDGLFEAIRKRHTFGTTGPKIALWLEAGDAMLGDVVERAGSGPIEFRVRATTGQAIEHVVLLRNNVVVHTFAAGGTDLDASWIDERPPDAPRLWYYVRLQRADGHLAWSSPIWFVQPPR